ncbi:MAG: WXG100 family type VII secretion target [Anaerolineae bacterium]|nr:WXG100 family type VII secretion target [Anaerolineae bacterium]
MVEITVAPERLESVARTFDAKKNDTESMISTLRSTMNDLNSDWDGVAQNKFYAEWDEMLPKMNQFTDLLGEIASELRRIAREFRELDENVI